MKSKIILLSWILVLFISSCGVSQSEYERLKVENARLVVELEECKFGEQKLVSSIENAYANKDYNRVKINFALLTKTHPESQKIAEFTKLIAKIDKEIFALEKKKKEEQLKLEKEKERNRLAEQKKKDAAKKEKTRLAKLNDIGVWDIRYYVDDFGEPTKSGYITTKNNIKGYFSNTATQDSKLNVRFLITDRKNISFKLFEYAGNNPVKSYSTDTYLVQVQDKDGSRFKLEANNYSDRLSFDKLDSETLHKILVKGGSIKFRIIEKKTPTTQYKFSLDNADGYENARRKLFGWE